MWAIRWGFNRLPAAKINFLLRVGFEPESCRAEHRLHAGAIWNPPVGLIMRVAVFNEMQLRIGRIVELCNGMEIVIRFHIHHLSATPLHALEDQKVLSNMLMDQIECEQRMAQMVENSHKHHQIEFLS